MTRNLGSNDLRSRLQAAASDLGVAPLDDTELLHLVRILTSHSLVVTPIFELIKFNDLIDAHFYPGTLRLLTETAEDEEAIGRLLSVPDHVRVLGDKCLFETGVARRKGPEGLDFEELGRKSYERAARVLDLLSRDTRLRRFYEQNTLNTMSLEDEVDFSLAARSCSRSTSAWTSLAATRSGGSLNTCRPPRSMAARIAS